MRYLFRILCVVSLAATADGVDAQEVGSPSPREPNAQSASPEAEEESASTSPQDAYGVRYARRKLAMPKGMTRGTFDSVVGNVQGDATATINLGAAFSPAKYLEIGFSRYRMGSYPSPDALRAPGGDGLIPIVVQGGDVFRASSNRERGFGNMLTYLRVEPPTDRAYGGEYGKAPSTSVADIAFDFGLVLPTASELGVFFGIPLRVHGGKVFAFDTGLAVHVDNIGEGSSQFTSIMLPWNLVFSATDYLFIKVNSGLDAIDVAGGNALKVFPLGLSVGGTLSKQRIMADIFTAFSWPALGTLDATGKITDIWMITIGTNLYSPVLF